MRSIKRIEIFAINEVTPRFDKKDVFLDCWTCFFFHKFVVFGLFLFWRVSGGCGSGDDDVIHALLPRLWREREPSDSAVGIIWMLIIKEATTLCARYVHFLVLFMIHLFCDLFFKGWGGGGWGLREGEFWLFFFLFRSLSSLYVGFFLLCMRVKNGLCQPFWNGMHHKLHSSLNCVVHDFHSHFSNFGMGFIHFQTLPHCIFLCVEVEWWWWLRWWGWMS